MENTGVKKVSPKLRTVLAVIAAAVALICLFAVGIQLFGSTKAENSSVIVYRKDSKNVIRINNKETVVDDLSASDFKCDKENKRVYYMVESLYADGLYDLYYVQQKRSEITKPRIIDFGLRKDYKIVSGKAYYSKVNTVTRADDGCVCDINSGKIEIYTENIEWYFPLENTDTVYFTRMHGENRVLYKYSASSPIEVCRNVNSVRVYNNSDAPHILYERESTIYPGMSELYIAYAQGAPELISDNTYRVNYDFYVPGGNLYYFTSSEENISWSYVIADAYAEDDKTAVRPKRSDYYSFFGVSSQYNEALREYQNKLVRDEIRAALTDSMEKSELSAPLFTAFVYNENGSFKLAEKVDPLKVYSVVVHGEPKIIYDASDIVQSSTDMGVLVDIAQRSSINEVISYAQDVIDKSVISLGITVSALTQDGVVSHKLNGYDKNKTVFAFSDSGSRIFALVRDTAGERLTLYSNSFNEKTVPSANQNIDTRISNYRFIGDYVVYLKDDTDKSTGDVYAYDGVKPQKLSNAASSFKVENEKDIIVLKEYDESGDVATADFYCCIDSKEKAVGKNILAPSFSVSSNGNAAYLVEEKGVKMLYVYSNGKSSDAGTNADEILFFE